MVLSRLFFIRSCANFIFKTPKPRDSRGGEARLTLRASRLHIRIESASLRVVAQPSVSGQIVQGLVRPNKLLSWVTVYQNVVDGQRSQPAVQALVLPSVFCLVLTGVTTLTYVVMDNVYLDRGVAEFTSGCITVAIVCAVLVFGFVVTTVRMQRVVEHQSRVLAKVQTDVQHQLDERGFSRKGDMLAVKMRVSKINVLQALDLYIRLAESKPKLLGLSLETIRWLTVIMGLVFLNAAFFMLYFKRCMG